LPDDEKKEIRGQRHDFIKEYYRMAVADLDRHLKGGWQTIAVLAGGAALLGLGHEGKITLPIAVALAIGIAWWGVLIVVDANYWSLRAIAFLANVEAVYFSVDDRRFFNPYAGYHPSYKLLDSLRYHVWIFVLFAALAAFDLIWVGWSRYSGFSLVWGKVLSLSWLNVLLWTAPLVVLLWGAVFVLATYRNRLRDYLSFSAESPGPEMRLHPADLRHVDFSAVTGEAAPATEHNAHAAGLEKLRELSIRLERSWLNTGAVVTAIVVTTTLCAFALAQAVRLH
jgi:hypothetical protein